MGWLASAWSGPQEQYSSFWRSTHTLCPAIWYKYCGENIIGYVATLRVLNSKKYSADTKIQQLYMLCEQR